MSESNKRPHIVDGQFQSDKYPTCPPGKVPLSVADYSAQDLLWEYAQRRRAVDAEFADDLEWALRRQDYDPAMGAGRYRAVVALSRGREPLELQPAASVAPQDPIDEESRSAVLKLLWDTHGVEGGTMLWEAAVRAESRNIGDISRRVDVLEEEIERIRPVYQAAGAWRDDGVTYNRCEDRTSASLLDAVDRARGER